MRCCSGKRVSRVQHVYGLRVMEFKSFQRYIGGSLALSVVIRSSSGRRVTSLTRQFISSGVVGQMAQSEMRPRSRSATASRSRAFTCACVACRSRAQ